MQTITSSCRRLAVAAAIVTAVAAPASAANKEHQQLAADIRMLQEQAQILQNMLGTLNESIKAVNARLDEQTNTMRKAFADEKLLIDNLSSDLRVVREKVDDNNVRITSLTQELDSLRQAMQQMARPTTTDQPAGVPPSTPPTIGTEAQQPPPGAPAPPPSVSPTQLYQMAWADYTGGQYDVAIKGFEAYIMTFPKGVQADEAQVTIGKSYSYLGDKQKALDAFDKAIRTYPGGKAIPDAYLQKGFVLRDLKQPDKAREAFEFVVKNFAQTDVASLARQQLDQLKKP